MHIDFHGWMPDDAVNEIHRMIGEARMSGKTTQITFITGNGKIKQIVFDICESYGILCREKIGNIGTLVAIVE